MKTTLACAFGTCLLLGAGAVQALGLVQAYEAALQHDPAYSAAVHENEAGRQSAAIGRSALLPTVSANYSTASSRADLTAPDALGQQATTHPGYRSVAAGVSLRQPLLNLEGVARYRQGLAQGAYSEAVFTGKKQELMVRLVAAYADAQYAKDQLALAVAQRDALAERKRLNERLFQQGEGTRTDVLETSAKIHLAEVQVIEAGDTLAQTHAVLAAHVGQDATPLDVLADDFRPRAPQPADIESWQATALQNNAEIATRRHAVEVAAQEVDKSRAGHAPRLDLVASVGRSNAETINTYNQNATVRSIGLQLNVPLYSGGYVDAVSRQARANRDKADAELDLALRQADIELRKQHHAVRSSAARIEALVHSVEAASLALKATQESVKGGVRVNLDVLNAQQQVYLAQRDLARARYDHLLSRLRLKLAAGTLAAADLREAASFFAAAH
jgi:protease secretion system outer membrane protein